MWKKKKVWIVTIILKDVDNDGEVINWTSPYEEHYAYTRKQAEQLREYFLSGNDDYYGDLVQDATISDSPEEREILDS